MCVDLHAVRLVIMSTLVPLRHIMHKAQLTHLNGWMMADAADTAADTMSLL